MIIIHCACLVYMSAFVSQLETKNLKMNILFLLYCRLMF